MRDVMKESRETLKERILEGAIELFIEKGIEKVTTRELTERLGLSRSHIYHYFEGWEALSIEAMKDFLQKDLNTVSARLRPLPPAEQLNAFVEIYLPDGPDTVWQLYGSLWQLAVHNARWSELAELMSGRWEKLLADIISEGIASGTFTSKKPAMLTRQLSAMLNGYSDQLLVTTGSQYRQQARDDINDFIRETML